MDEIQRLIGVIQESALTSEGPEVAIHEVARSFGASASYYFMMRPELGAGFIASSSSGFDASANAHYEAEMWRHDYAIPAARNVGQIFESHQLLSPQQRVRNEFARWKRKTAGTDRLIGRSSLSPDGLLTGLTLHFPVGLQSRKAERIRFERIAPHIARSFEFSGQFAELRNLRRSLTVVMEAMPHAVLLLKQNGEIEWSNAAARNILSLKDGLGLKYGRLILHQQKSARALELALARLGSGTLADRDPEALTVAVSRPSGRRPYVIRLSEPSQHMRVEFGSRLATMVMIYDADRSRDNNSPVWQQMFDLTVAEARIANLLMAGMADERIALRFGVQVSTVRSHVRAILDKTNTRSKPELAHLLTSLA